MTDTLTVQIDRVLRLSEIYDRCGYTSQAAAAKACAAGRFPVKHAARRPWRFTALDVAAFTQKGEITNPRLLDRTPTPRRHFGKARARLAS